MPGVILERPKISHAMWEALKTHIIRERQRKKQEQEADAEEERQRKEREKKHKEDVMTLEETKDQVVTMEKRLSSLKEDKHQLFMQLKKVLNEDETRKRQQLIKEDIFAPPGYNPTHHSGHSQLLPQSFPPMPGKPGGLYKMNPSPPKPQSNNILKRTRSPSPPYQQPYKGGQNFNSHSKNLNSHSIANSPYYPPPAPSHPISSAISSSYHHTPSVYSYAGPNQFQQQVVSIPETKPITGTYITHVNSSQTRGYIGSLHQQLDQANHKSGFTGNGQGQDPGKYYVVHNNPLPLRNSSHVNMSTPGIISLHQRDPKAGSITQGYPVRPNPSHSSQNSSGYPPNTISNPHNVYPSHSPSRLLQSHPHGRLY